MNHAPPLPAVGGHLRWLTGRPAQAMLAIRRERLHLIQGGLDLAMLAIVALTYLQQGQPDVLFHIVWLLLAFHAFLFGLRSTLIRICSATAALLLYAAGSQAGMLVAELDLVEWPLMFVIAVAVAVMADRVRSTSERYARLYRLAQDRLLTAQEADRAQMALDLHDSLGQTLSALSMALEVAAQGRPATPRSRRAIELARELTSTATEETRDVARRLRPPRIEQVGLAGAVRELARRTGMPVRVRIDETDAAPLHPDIAIGAYRIVQEALANAARHARAKAILVTYSQTAADLSIGIQDDGCGFEVSALPDRGLGLTGMLERANVLGGELTVRSALGLGTVVELVVPLGPRSPSGHRVDQLGSDPAAAEAS